MTGRITRLVEDRRRGTIASEDGADDEFVGRSLTGVTFSMRHLGMRITFTPSTTSGAHQAMSVRVPANKKGGPPSRYALWWTTCAWDRERRLVARDRIELSTLRFSIVCSTN